MSAALDRTTTKPKRVLMVVANPTPSRYGGRKLGELVIEALGV